MTGDGTSAYPVPQATIELASEVADWSGLYGDPPLSSPGYAQLLMPVAPEDPYSALAERIGYGSPQQPVPSYPGIRELAERLQLR